MQFKIIRNTLKKYIKDDNENEVVIPDGVSIIGTYALSSCKAEKIIIPSSVKTIREHAFDDCRYVKDLVIPDSVTHIYGNAFEDCKSLEKISLSDNIKTLNSRLFWGCSNLKTITIPASVSRIDSSVFFVSLEEVNVHCDNRYFCSEDGVLFNKSRTVLLKYPADKKDKTYCIPEGVTKIGNEAFYRNEHLTSVVIPKSVRRICESAFQYCDKLSEITFKGKEPVIEAGAFVDTEWIKNKPDDFVIFNKSVLHCYKGSNQKVIVPDGITRICQYAFDSDTIKSIVIPDSVTDIEKFAFFRCDNLAEVVLSENLNEITEGMFFSTEITSLNIPSSVKAIGASAFRSCKSLNEIKIPMGVKNIGTYAFKYSSLKYIEIADTVETIGREAFAYCDKLTEVKMSSSLKRIESACFANVCKLKRIVIPEKTESIGKNAFFQCHSLNEVILPEKLKRIERYAFARCKKLRSIAIPESVDLIEEAAFISCYNLEEIKIEKTMPVFYGRQDYGIELSAFTNCGLKRKDKFVIINDIMYRYNGREHNVVIPDGIKYLDVSFLGNKHQLRKTLKTVTIPDSVELIVYIPYKFDGISIVNTDSYASRRLKKLREKYIEKQHIINPISP